MLDAIFLKTASPVARCAVGYISALSACFLLHSYDLRTAVFSMVVSSSVTVICCAWSEYIISGCYNNLRARKQLASLWLGHPYSKFLFIKFCQRLLVTLCALADMNPWLAHWPWYYSRSFQLCIVRPHTAELVLDKLFKYFSSYIFYVRLLMIEEFCDPNAPIGLMHHVIMSNQEVSYVIVRVAWHSGRGLIMWAWPNTSQNGADSLWRHLINVSMTFIAIGILALQWYSMLQNLIVKHRFALVSFSKNLLVTVYRLWSFVDELENE